MHFQLFNLFLSAGAAEAVAAEVVAVVVDAVGDAADAAAPALRSTLAARRFASLRSGLLRHIMRTSHGVCMAYNGCNASM